MTKKICDRCGAEINPAGSASAVYKMPEVQQGLGGGLSNSGEAAGMP